MRVYVYARMCVRAYVHACACVSVIPARKNAARPKTSSTNRQGEKKTRTRGRHTQSQEHESA